MTFELILFLVFLFYHFTAAIVLSAAADWICCGKRQPTAKVAYGLWLAVFMLATVFPVGQTFWHGQNLAQSIGEHRSALPFGSANVNEANQAPVSFNLSLPAEATPATSPPSIAPAEAPSVVFVTSSSNRLYLADQLGYLLIPLLEFVAGIMVIGIAIGLLRTLRLLAKTAWLIHRAEKLQLPWAWQTTITLPVLLSEKITTPMAAGLFNPVILLPTRLIDQLDKKQLQHVLLHEQAHHDRRDLLASVLLRLIDAVFWWSPALKTINSKIKLYREMLCDEVAAVKVGDSVGYAQSLLDCAKLAVAQRSGYIGVELVGYGSDLGQRINGLLEFDKPRRPVSILLMLLICFSLAAGTSLSRVSQALVNDEALVRITREHQLHTAETGQALIAAVTQGDPAALRRLVQAGVNPDIPIAKHGTALMFAVATNSGPMVAELIDLGADPNQAAIRYGNPLIVAAMTGQTDIAGMLLAAGADVNAVVPRDETPLIGAARNSQLEMVGFLIANGADVNLGVRASAFDGLEYRTGLSVASDAEVKAYLIAAGAI